MEEEEEGLIAVKLMIASAISKTNMKFLDKVLKSGFFLVLVVFPKRRQKIQIRKHFYPPLHLLVKLVGRCVNI